MQLFHDEARDLINAAPGQVFDYLDDHRNLSAHMSKSSWMMAGTRMNIELDAGHGRTVGSRIRLSGKMLGVDLAVDEAVTERIPPYRKVWRTLGQPRLIVIGAYQMGFEITARGHAADLRVFIDYEPSAARSLRWIRRKLAAFYARWCTRRMAADAARHFSSMEDQQMSATTSPFPAARSVGTVPVSRSIDSRSLGLAAACSVGLAFTICSLIVVAAPGVLARFTGYALHLDISGLTREITPMSFLVGLGFLMVYAGAIISATGALYNRLIARRS